MINIGDNRLVSGPAIVSAELGSPSPRAQFSAMLMALATVHERASVPAAGGITLAESTAVLQLMEMLTQAHSGNYDDPRWPKRRTKSGRPKPWIAKSRAEQHLIALAQLCKRITRCEIEQACDQAVRDVAKFLREKHGMDLTREFAVYDVQTEAGARPDQRTRGLKRTGEKRLANDAVSLDTIARRVVNWWKNGRSDDIEHKAEFDLGLNGPSPQDQYRAALAVTSLQFVYATRHESERPNDVNLQVMRLHK